MQLLNELVILFVAANPKPDHQLTITARKRAIMISDPHGPNIRAERLKLDGRVKWIALP